MRQFKARAALKNSAFRWKSEGCGASTDDAIGVPRGQAENTGEADLSTEQAGAQAASRIPQPHGNQWWPQGAQCPPWPRPEAAQRLSRRAARASAVERLRKRADFLGVAAGPRAPTEAFVLQARERSDTGSPRVGFTVSRKVGNAVERNRARRRLREVVRLCDAERFKAGNDYVLIGRRPALELPFDRLVDDFARALARVNQQRRAPRRPADRRGGGRGEVSPAGSQTSS